MPKWHILASFWKSEACCHTVLPDRSILIGQKSLKMPRSHNFNVTFWVLVFKQCDEMVNVQYEHTNQSNLRN